MSNDVLITPASRKIEFKDSSANVDAKIETDASGNLLITNTGGDISIGDTTSDIFVGDGTNNIDIVFEQDGEIRGTSGVTVTLGASGSNIRMASDLNLNSNDITNVGDLTVTGNLTITGDINSYNVTDLDVSDKTITLGVGQTEANSGSSGIIIDGSAASMLWDEGDNRFEFNKNIYAPVIYGSGAGITSLNGSNISSGTVAAARIASLAASKITSGTFADARISSSSVTQHLGSYLTGNQTITLTGDASGSGTTSIAVTVANDSHNHTKLFENATITFGASQFQWMDQDGTGGTGLNGAAPRNPANGWYHNLIMNHANSNGYYSQIATGLNSSDIYFSRVQNGTAQSWQRIFADDYHPNADKWTTARTLSLTGAVTGSVSWDGSGNASIATTATADPTLTLSGDASGSATFTNLGNATLSVTVADDSHNHVISNVDGLQSALDAKLPLAGGTMTGTLTGVQITATTTADATPALIATNTGGINGVIQRWIGETDSMELRNMDTGDYELMNTQQNNGIVFRDGTGGVEIHYNGNEIVEVGSLGGLVLISGALQIPSNLQHKDDSDTYINFTDNRVQIYAGGSSKFDSNNTYFHDGYHPNADTWTTARTITLAGDLSGNVSINGSANVTLTAAVVDDSHNHVISNVDGLQTALDAKLPLAGGTMTGTINAGGGINGLTLSNGISGSNFDISGVNQLTINDPGEGIVFGGGSTTMSLAIVDDATDRILRYSGTGAVFDVQGNITLTGTVDGVDIAARNAILTSTTTTANAALPKAGGTMTGNLTIPDQIIHSGDTNTYMQFHAADQWRVVTGGAERLEVNNSAVTVGGALNVGTLKVDGKTVLDLPSNNPERGPWNPIVSSIRNSGRRLYQDEEFSSGTNSVGVYNNAGGGVVSITREAATTNSGGAAPNSSGQVLRVNHNGGTSSPGFGGFIHTIPSEDNHTFVQIFQAKLRTGSNFVIAENAQGSNNTSYWLTETAGTGKWEWYARISHCGNTGTFSSGGHVYVSGGSGNFNWYLASSTVIDVTESAGSVDRTHLAADIIDSTKIADNAINSEHYVDGSIDRVHLAADIIDGTKIANDVINSEHYVAGSIDREHLAADIIDGTKIADDVINSEHYAHNSIDALHLNVSGNGTTSQYLRSDGDGTMSWVTPPDTTNFVPLAGGTMTGALTVNANIDLGSTDTATRYLHLPRGGGITLYGDTSVHHGIFSRNQSNGTADDILLSSYGAVYIDLDSNSNNSDEASFVIGRHNTTSQNLFSVDGESGNVNISNDDAVLQFGIPGNGANVNGCWASLEGNTDSSGEGSGRLFFREHNSTTGSMDAYGMSLGYRGGATALTTAGGNSWTGLANIGNGEWGMWGHDGDATGALIMHGPRSGEYVDIGGDLYVPDQIRHTGDTNTYMQFHAADQWRVVTGGSERLECNNTRTTIQQGYLQVTGSTSHLVPTTTATGATTRLGLTATHKTAVVLDTSSTATTGTRRIYAIENNAGANLRIGNPDFPNAFNVSSTGNISSTGDVIAYSSSDRRFKDNITPISNPMEKINKLSGNTFEWNGNQETYEKGMKDVGVIAQEVEEVLPEIVDTREDGYKAVKYEKMVALLIEGIKEQQETINKLMDRINDLEKGE